MNNRGLSPITLVVCPLLPSITFNHFHVDVRRPDRLALPPNLLADEAVVSQPQTAADADLLAAAQALLEQVQPTLSFEKGDVTMFVMDVPPEIPPQYAPIVIAQSPQTQRSGTAFDRTIGVCQLVENPRGQYPGAEGMNAVGPGGVVRNYLWIFEKQRIDLKSAKVAILKDPEHGIFEERGGMLIYVSKPDYFGPDRATFLVEVDGSKIKVEYFIRVMENVPGGTEGYDPLEDKGLCPNGHYWKISLNLDDPNAPIYTFEHPSQLTNALAGVVQANLTFTDLAGGALGETQGNTITLDTNAAGHGWFLDTTP